MLVIITLRHVFLQVVKPANMCLFRADSGDFPLKTRKACAHARESLSFASVPLHRLALHIAKKY